MNARTKIVVALAACVSLGVSPAAAQVPPGVPMPMAPPGAAGGQPGGPTGTCGTGGGGRIAGDVAVAGRGKLVPSAVSVMPSTPLTEAYVDNMRMALGSPADRARSLGVGHDPTALNKTLYLAMHQADIVASTHYAQWAGTHFSCAGLVPGLYLVMAIVNEAYKPRPPYSKYVASGNHLVFYVARALVVKSKPNAPPHASPPTSFKMVGATESAM